MERQLSNIEISARHIERQLSNLEKNGPPMDNQLTYLNKNEDLVNNNVISNNGMIETDDVKESERETSRF